MNKEILQKAIDTYGVDAQSDMVIEEALELALAILKHRRAVRFQPEKIHERRKNVIEESADTKIMIEQVEMMFDCKDEVQEQMKFKVDRLKKRLEDSYGVI